uniref:Protein-lysine N-methyltransferase SMYD4 n=1 Tax=Naja naja TaxID=35670 RepID=A0A8C6V6V3_NAJNA
MSHREAWLQGRGGKGAPWGREGAKPPRLLTISCSTGLSTGSSCSMACAGVGEREGESAGEGRSAREPPPHRDGAGLAHLDGALAQPPRRRHPSAAPPPPAPLPAHSQPGSAFLAPPPPPRAPRRRPRLVERAPPRPASSPSRGACRKDGAAAGRGMAGAGGAPLGVSGGAAEGGAKPRAVAPGDAPPRRAPPPVSPAPLRLPPPAASPRAPLFPALTLQRSPRRTPEEEAFLRRLSRRLSVRKEPRLAEPCRQEGNRRFRAGQYRAAAALYSRALSHTEAGSPEMAICYANRSAALLHLGHFEVCLEDIGRAQQVGSCPEKLLPKIQLRRAECLLALGRLREAAGALHSVQESLSADQRPEAARHQALLGRLDELRGGAGEESGASLCPRAVPSQAAPDPEPWEESGRISGASLAVSLGFSSCKGRHLVATEDLPPGKLLVREAAFASVLCPGQSLLLEGTAQALQDGEPANPDLHCHHCLRPLLASVPCRGCSYSRYCGPTCAQLAWSGYHWAECALGGLLLALGVFCHLAFRTVLVAGFAQVEASVAQSQEGGASAVAAAAEKSAWPVPGCEADGRYSGSYRAVFSLLPHTERHSPGFRFLCGLSVAALCRALEDAGLEAWMAGGATESEEASEAAPTALEVLGEAMLRHVLQLQCNGQAVTTLRPSGPEDGLVAGSGQVRLATGFFPALSLLNHSCDPNTSVAFTGCTVEVRALRPIPLGQELLHCYGPHRCRMGAAERRRRLLAQYFFECRCQACLEELQPSGAPSAPEAGLFRCPACQRPMQGRGTLRCSGETCNHLVPEEDFHRRLLRLQGWAQSAEELLQHGKPGESHTHVRTHMVCVLVASPEAGKAPEENVASLQHDVFIYLCPTL